MTPPSPVCVTGVGSVTPAGPGAAALWSAAVAAVSTAVTLPDLVASGHRVTIGCPVREVSPPAGLAAKAFRRMDRFAQLGVAAGVEAFDDAGQPDVANDRLAIVVGNAVGGRRTSDRESISYARSGPDAVSPLMPTMTMPNAAAAMLSIQLGATGPCPTVATTCASGVDAIGHAVGLLQTDQADVVVAGGCESTLSPVTMAAFAALNALSSRNDEPQRASRPFDRARDGFVMGEGAAFLVLEREADARARNARIHGRILGYAATTDSFHLTQPHPAGRGVETAVRGALRAADVTAADITHLNAHGTSTPLNDRTEATVIGRVFGNTALPVTALKGVTGHMLGASGAAEALVTLAALQNGLVPPVANHTEPDPDCPVDVVVSEPRHIRPGPALTTSFGFGGHNAALVLV